MDEKYLEQAQSLEQAARDTALLASRAKLAGHGQADCADCGCTIPAARRLAAPAAIRCIDCQTRFERL